MGVIQNIISRHDSLKVLQRSLKNIRNNDFQKRVLEKDPYTVTLNRQNEVAMHSSDMRERTLYQIEIGTVGEGFFAEYRRTLNYLYYADVWGFVPYIHYGTDYNYSEKVPVNGTENPFEYYFVQPCVTKEESLSYRYIVRSRSVDVELVNPLKPVNGYGFSDEYLRVMAQISRKYIKFNEMTANYLVKGLVSLLANKKTLGIHVRLTDFKNNYWGHPVCITADRHLSYAKVAMKKYAYEQIFLATDDIETIQLFQKEFGERLVYYKDVVRSDGAVSVAFSQSDRELHHYKLGLEVLRDMYTLALCQGLIAGKSQVSICAMIENLLHEPYEYVEIIDQGYNSDRSNLFSETKEANAKLE